MSALRILFSIFGGRFSILIISKIIFFTKGAFTTAPVILCFELSSFLGYSIAVYTINLGLLIGNTPIN